MSAPESTDPLPSWPDHFHLDAARGWLGLGNPDEAWRELDAMSAPSRQKPATLALECHLRALASEWQAVVDLAERWVQQSPEQAEAWIQRSYALHELRRTQEAWDKLFPAATLFSGHTTIAYNLGCYACQLGQLDTARRWLRQSLRNCDAAARVVWQAAALSDRDLEPLREELAGDQWS